MRITEKNDFIVKNKKPQFFSKDVELLVKEIPESKLHQELKRVHSFNRGKLHGIVLCELLEKVSTEEILKNRISETEEVNPELPETDPDKTGADNGCDTELFKTEAGTEKTPETIALGRSSTDMETPMGETEAAAEETRETIAMESSSTDTETPMGETEAAAKETRETIAMESSSTDTEPPMAETTAATDVTPGPKKKGTKVKNSPK